MGQSIQQLPEAITGQSADLLILDQSDATRHITKANFLDVNMFATKTVAASNSDKKAYADYECDGTDDQVQIQAAIDALGSKGGKVVLLEGTYTVTAPIVLDAIQNVIVEGMGRATKIDVSASFVGDYVIQITNGFDAAFYRFQIDGNNVSGDQDVLRGLAYSSQDSGTNENTFIVRDMWIHHCEGDGLLSNGRGNNVIAFNTLEWNDTRGLHLSSQSFNYKILGNTIQHNLAGGIFFCARIKGATVHGNYIRDNQYGIEGISSSETSGQDRHISITGNIFVRNRQWDIHAYGAVNTTISGNNIGSQTFDAVGGDWRFDQVYGYGHVGIVIEDDVNDRKASQIVISGNSIGENYAFTEAGDWGYRCGIRLNGTENVLVVGNQIGLGSQRDAAYDIYGIEVNENNINATIVNNVIEDWLDAGVYVANYATNVGTIIRGNTITQIERDQRYGVVVAGANATGTIIENNVVSGNSTAAISDSGTETIKRFNSGYVTENEGVASIADGGTIVHGCAEAPTIVNLTAANQGYIVSVSSIDATNITVDIVDYSGTQITSSVNVYWSAKV